jgi:transposase
VGKKTGPNPTDRAKKGTKWSLLTDGRGLPLGLVVAGANTNDFKLVQQTFDSVPVKRPKPTRRRRLHLCLDAGYDCQQVRTWAARRGFSLHVRPRRPPARPPKKSRRKKVRRWVVERSHSFLHRFRRLLVRWEKREDTYLAMLHLAMGIVTWFHDLLPR